MKKKYYAVKDGYKIGVFDTWAECQKQINGYSGAVYKSFSAMEEALDYLKGEKGAEFKGEEFPQKDEIFAYVDGSYDVKTAAYSYGVVIIFHDGNVEKLNGRHENDAAASMRNVAGELKGAVIAMQYAVNNNYKKLTIFHDYEGIGRWARKEWKANLEPTKAYRDFCEKIYNTIEKLTFVKVAAHTGIIYNEMADELAKEALFASEQLTRNNEGVTS